MRALGSARWPGVATPRLCDLGQSLISLNHLFKTRMTPSPWNNCYEESMTTHLKCLACAGPHSTYRRVTKRSSPCSHLLDAKKHRLPGTVCSRHLWAPDSNPGATCPHLPPEEQRRKEATCLSPPAIFCCLGPHLDPNSAHCFILSLFRALI